MRHVPAVLFLAFTAFTPTFGQSTIVPKVLNTFQTSQVPYAYNGFITVGNFVGSASLVESGVITTAAHVIFDDESLAWEPTNRLRFYPRNHSTLPIPVSNSSYPPMAFFRWDSYKTRVENDESGIGLSSIDTFNIDFAAAYLSRFITDSKIQSFPEVHVDAEEMVSILRDDRQKMIVGYPSDEDFIPSNEVGLMHATTPANYFCFWTGFDDEGYNVELPDDSWRDTEGFWVTTYTFENLNTYQGNSGGPMYVKDDEGNWVVAGVLVGSVGSTGVLIRGIDENAWSLIEAAIGARGTSQIRRVSDLTAEQNSGTTILLEWTDNSPGEEAYLIYRLDGDLWEVIDTVPADRTAYGDVQVIPGQVYRYCVQAVGPNGARAPKSQIVTVVTEGRSTVAANYFSQPWLGFVTDGDSNWFVDATNRLRAGKVGSLGKSALRLDIIGPGTLDFAWSVSSEVNPDYNTPGPTFREIYDAVYLNLNGSRVTEGTEPVFLSGTIGSTPRQMVLPAGNHSIEWIYEKDPYSSAGEDTAALQALTWNPGSSNPYPVLGGFALEDETWHSSVWFGPYISTGTPWVDHSELGWLYLRPGNGEDLYFYSPLPELGDLYTHPTVFPHVYHVGRGVWLYYYQSSGTFGERLWFFDREAGEPFRIN